MKKDLKQKEILKCRKYDQEHGTDYFKTEELLEFIINKTDETTNTYNTWSTLEPVRAKTQPKQIRREI
jgi:hypothetical protein